MMRILRAALSGFWEGLRAPVPEAQATKRDLKKRTAHIDAEIRRRARIEAEAYQAALRGRASR